jgi:hypothetical protein
MTASNVFFMFAKPFLYQQTHEFKLIDMNEKKTLMTLVSLLLVAMSGLTLAISVAEESPERIVGVKVGARVKYGNFFATYESNDPDAQTPPADLIEHNNTEWVTNTVESINGTKITFQTVTHYKNDTETTSSAYVDINTGAGNGTFTFISANLNQGESIYGSTEYDPIWINETIQLVYANALRETNSLAATTSQYVSNEIEQNIAYRIEYFWDKMTGVLSERTGTIVITTANYSTVAMRSEVMIDTNIWGETPDTTPPTARAGPDQTTIVNQSVSLDAGSSSDNEGGWGIASYQWDFGDGTQGTGMVTSHAFSATGNYIVTLTVEDWAGNSDKDTLTVTVRESSSQPSIMGIIVLVIMLFVAGLFLWRLKAKK